MDKLVIKDIVKKINQNIILNHICLEIEPGLVFGIIGQNGAGKSTLLKIICGLSKPTSGDITLNGISIKKETNLIMDRMGFLIEEPALYSYLTGRQQLDYCVNLRNFSDKGYKDSIIEKLGLETFLDKKISKCSSGMKQRLGIACAVIHNPSIVILDEPTNSLDITGIKEVRGFLKQMRDEGKTVILSSHMLSEVEDICDQIVMMDKGNIIDAFRLNTISQRQEDIYEIKLENTEDLINFVGKKYKGNILMIKDNHITLGAMENELSDMLKNILGNGFEIMGIQKKGKQLEEYYLRKVGKDNV